MTSERSSRARRLVTLTGVGGAGKTRLASELALRLDWQRADSVAWVDLAACGEPGFAAQQVAAAVSLRVTHGGEISDALIDALRERELLLIFDNCEHVIAACAELARALLVEAPKLRILTTSREPLSVAGEHVWPVPPIAPDEAVLLWSDGVRWMTRALEHAPAAVSRDRASTLAAAGTFATYLGDTASGRDRLEEAEAMWRALKDDRELALTLSARTHLLTNLGELEAASALAAESVALARAPARPSTSPTASATRRPSSRSAEHEELARSLGIAATFVHVPFYYENFLYFFPPRPAGDGSYRFGFPQGDTPLAAISVEDVGPIVAPMFEQFEVWIG